MTRQEFEAALLPLTPTEQAAKNDPNYIRRLYHSKNVPGSVDQKGVAHFPKHLVFQRLSNILPELEQQNHYISSDVGFNRHDRFVVIPMHAHEYIEMNYVLSGSCSANVNNNELLLHAGDICIMDRNASHTLYATGEQDIILNILMNTEYFTSSFLESLLSGGSVSKFLADVIAENNEHDQYLLFHTTDRPLIKELIENTFLEYLNPGICCKEIIRHNLGLLFIELARCYQGQMEQKHHQKNRSYLTEILYYIDTHSSDCSLEEVAKHFNFHPNYLTRLLKAETGSSFQTLIDESRMNRAIFLLTNSELPIYQIASDCGYQNHSFFRRKFQNRYGQTPSEYRMKSAQGSDK